MDRNYSTAPNFGGIRILELNIACHSPHLPKGGDIHIFTLMEAQIRNLSDNVCQGRSLI